MSSEIEDKGIDPNKIKNLIEKAKTMTNVFSEKESFADVPNMGMLKDIMENAKA